MKHIGMYFTTKWEEVDQDAKGTCTRGQRSLPWQASTTGQER